MRSSWPASATNPRSRSRADSSLASIPLSVVPRRSSSSPVGGTGSRSPGRSAEIAAARRRIASTALSPAPASRYPSAVASTSAKGPATRSSVRRLRSASARFSRVAPTTRTSLRPPRSMGSPSSRAGSSRPGTPPTSTNVLPLLARRTSGGVRSGRRPIGRVASSTPARGSISWAKLSPLSINRPLDSPASDAERSASSAERSCPRSRRSWLRARLRSVPSFS